MTLDNPLTFETIPELILAIINIFVIVAIPIVIFFLILAGFHYVTARGNPEKIKAASQALLFGLIGGVIIIGAFTIMAIVENVVEGFK